ncbi:zinc finger protein 557-like [Anopheles funestus]|uniref:zinc finger protein 557-like n=1 Tax=Anopheles funestus TaxID=62324 RepID=UPI0020C6BB15|nr:zinc finger protein 557-like [Anopheles funestus]XP_049285797.1 zinc finger protein 557-like [Anopheles funestus]
MDGSPEELNLVEFNIIDNIIGSAVDDLMLKDNTDVHQYDYNALASLLLPLCRFCARENAQMVHISDVHLQIINDLRIPEAHGTNVCTNICSSCNGFLEEFCKFRSVCEEGQKRIATLLAERQHGMASFVDVKLDFTVARKDLLPATVMDEPATAKMLNSIQTVEPGLMELAERECPNYTENILILAPISPAVQPQNSSQPAEETHLMEQKIVFDSSQSDTCQYVTHSLEECNFIPQYEQQSFKSFIENMKHANDVVESPSENKALSQVDEAEVKDSKKPEARRRVVDGRLQWVCLDCEQVFGSCFQLKKHRRSCELVGSKTSKRIATLVCDICGETMSTESALTMHRRKHEAKTNGPTIKSASAVKLELTVCHVCGHTSKSRRALRLHLITHSSDKNVECPICGKRFKRRRDLRNHLDVHSGRKHECDACGKKFLTKATLRNHAKTHRDSYLKHECTVCARQFVHAHQLQKHMVIHTNEYPYVCEICKAVFRTLGRFKRHIQKGHTLPTSNMNVIEQTALNSWDDLIEYQPEVVPCETLDETVSEEMLHRVDPVCDTGLPEIFDSFGTDPILDQGSPQFAVQGFPDGSDRDDDGFYYCYESTFLGTSVAVINR